VASELGIITAGIPEVDECPVLTRLKAFLVDQGTHATLEHTFRDRKGNPIDLSPIFGPENNSVSTAEAGGKVRLRIKEAVGRGLSPEQNPLWENPAWDYAPSMGVVRATLDPKIVDRRGVYQLCWAIEDANKKILCVDNAIMSVEASLFAMDINNVMDGMGSLTVQELRMTMMDSSPSENLRLDDIEFGAEQILLALTRPIDYFNERPPPLGYKFSTRNFPFREAWRKAALAHLYEFAATNYRRNHLSYQAGGTAIDDLNRFNEYGQASKELMAEWTEFVNLKKLELNMMQVSGHVGSPYGGMRGF